jgi:hypothetical protein
MEDHGERELMITRTELKRMADAKRMSLENAEKDYLLDMLLFNIYHESGNKLVFKGGTSLYKFFNLNRFSEDLDFTQNSRRFDGEGLSGQLRRRLASIGIDAGKAEIESTGNETNIVFNIKGPLYDGSKRSLCRIAMNISKRERIMLDPKPDLYVPSAKEIPSFQVFVMDEREIMAEKVRALMTREKPRDLYDLWFLLKRGVKPDLDLIDSKLKIYKKKFSREEFANRVEAKEKSWKTGLSGLVIGPLVDFKLARDEVLRQF